MQGVRERAQKLFPWRFLNFQVAHPQFKKAQDKILGNFSLGEDPVLSPSLWFEKIM
jgi:hypothetical protein